MANTRSGMTHAAIEEMIDQRVNAALEAHQVNQNLEHGNNHGNENGNGNGNENGNGNGNNGGDNGDGNENHNVNGRGDRLVARKCTYQDIMKCQPVTPPKSGSSGIVTLGCYFKYNKQDIGNDQELVGLISALTLWNSHKRTIGTDAAYALSWRELMKLMTEVYCLRNEIQKMETELWNLSVKNNDIASYTQRFQELTMMCTKMVPEEEDRVEKFIGGLPDNIQGNLCRRQEIDGQQTMEYNRGANPPHKRQIMGQNVARDYVAMWEVQQDLARRPETARVTNPATPTQRGQIVNQRDVTCFKCGAPGHFRKDCPKIKNQNRGDKARVPNARGKAYVLRGGDANPGPNTVMGTFFLNDHHAYMLFDSGFDRSFVSNTFSALLDIIPYALDISYAAELADGRTS
ncbi:putative reverse transcriptase domain-containing protein [Tanacetum coccineum]